MRKLGKVGKKENTSLKSIVGMCTCSAICRPGDKVNRDFAWELQRDYAYTGTMPQGIDI